ncbi:MAG: DNA polymerase III subunit beta, partial [Streptococcaceae bacterium]|nr:DNA polymerase III subunit beta [Streptococcaceae bacterium]
KLPSEEILIHQQQGQNILIKTTSSEFTIIGLTSEEFPNIMEIDDNNSQKISIDKEVFKNMIRQTAFSASIDESKGIITGVLIELHEDSINMVALDGFRMAVVKEEMRNESDTKIIIAAKILTEINKIISEIEGNEDLIFMLNNKKAVILLENTKIVLRLLDGEFIKYKDILPKESKCKVRIAKQELYQSVERASLLSKEGKNNLIKFMISDQALIVTSRSEEGAVKEEVVIEHEGEDIEIGFNSKYILDVLKILDEETLLLEMNASIKPCLIKPASGDRFKYLVLPVRISSN